MNFAGQEWSSKTRSSYLQCGRIALGVMIVFLFGVGQNRSDAATVELPEGFPIVHLPGRLHGDGAISALGSRLAEVAAFYRVSETELRRRLQRDRSLWVDQRGRLLYVCEWPQQVPDAEVESGFHWFSLSAAGYPYEHTFRLHSRPGATKIIYLDFDGHDASGTSWGSDAIARPFDTDGDPATFSNSERDRIQYIWQRVSEDFALYDVDVTTEDPGVEALRKANGSDAIYGIRTVIGGSSSDWYGSAGGVAYVGTFNGSSDTPCWIFPKSLGDSEKNIAEAISHEVGHTLGLNHDGRDVNGDHTEYYSGHGDWAPIMGVGYSKPISQWSKGEYANANSTQDDLAVMLGEGVSYRPDDHGNSVATATALGGPTLAASGNIERNTDLDFFSFETGAGRVRVSITPFVRGANLHPQLSLYDGNGNLLVSTDAADTSSGAQTVVAYLDVPAGKYYFSVDGIGVGDPATTGYSGYGSLGQYTVGGLLPADSAWLPVTAGTYSWTDGLYWASNTVPLGAGVISRFTKDITGDQVVMVDAAITTGALLLGDVDGSHSFSIQAGGSSSLTFASLTGVAAINKSGSAPDLIAAATVLQTDLFITTSGNGSLTFSGTLGGSGGLMKLGSGVLILEATNHYTGPTRVLGGTLVLRAGATLPSPALEVMANTVLDASAAGLSLASNQSLAGQGTVLGDVDAGPGSLLAPGGLGVVGTLTLSNDLTLSPGATMRFDLASGTTAGGGTNDLLLINGDLDLRSGALVDFLLPTNGLVSPGAYTLMWYSGLLIGGASNLNSLTASNRYQFDLDDTVPGEIRVHVSGTPNHLAWQGDGVLNRWDVMGTANWLGLTNEMFAQLDTVAFTDSGSASPAINLLGILQPASVSVNSGSNYTFSGSGRLSGPTGIIKAGTGTLSLNTTNVFGGEVLVQAGRVKVGNAAALGTTSGGTAIQVGGQLDLNAVNLGAEIVAVAGAGPASAGALNNGNATAQTNALRFVTLTDDATFGGVGRWDIRANPTGSLSGGGHGLTKTGPNEIWLAELGETSLGNVVVQQGLLGLEGSTKLGDANATLTLSPGTTLAFARTDMNVLSKKLSVTNATLRSDAGNNIFGGTINLNATNTVNVTAGLNLQGVIGGAGGLTKTGSGILTLATANTFAGAVTVNSGTLRAKHTAALGDTNGPTIISTGARLDINGVNLGAERVVVQGTGLGNAGAIINYGGGQNNALRFVTLSGNTTFGGINRWDVRANPTASFTGNNFTLTKTGPNEIWLVDAGPSGLANITVNDGLLGIQGNTTLGNSASTITVNSSALGFWGNGTNILSKRLTLSSSRLSNGSGSNTFIGPITLIGSNRFDLASASTLALGGAVSGSGVLHVISAGRLVFAANNSYSGVTIVDAGTLQVGAGGTAGSLGTGNVTNHSVLVFDRGNDLSVANSIRGAGALNQQGVGTLTLSGANSYAGLTTISRGIVKAGNASALGTTASGTTVAPGATLDVNGLNLGAEAITVGGAGMSDAGAIINRGAAQSNALRYVTLNGHTTFGGVNRWDLRDPGAGGSSALNGGGFTLTKVSSNQIWFANLGNSALGDIVVSAGSLYVQGTTTLGNAGKALIVTNGATFGLVSTGTNVLNKVLKVTDARVLGGSGSNVLAGATTFTGTGLVEVATSSSLTLDGVIAGSGGLTKTGGGSLLLTRSNLFTGETTIAGGILVLGADGGIATSPQLRVAAGAALDVAVVSGGFALATSQALSGNGTIRGDFMAGGVIAPGDSVGRLSFNDSLILAGELIIETSKTGGALTNDSLLVGEALVLGGALTLQHTGEEIGAGDAFPLFSAAAITGTFEHLNLPPLGPGLHWDVSGLAVDGWLRISTALIPPVVEPLHFDGTNLLLQIASDPGVTYVLEASASLAPPVNWIGIATNSGTGGVLTFPAPVNPSEPQHFFRVNAY